MPLKIIRQDITKIKCDAIVNPTNSNLWPGGGVDNAIHSAAGSQLLICSRSLVPCSVGQAKITPAFNLPCKYVIHTVGPKWTGGMKGEEILLRSCYSEAIRLALENECQSIAFPLISSGTHGYPKDKVLRVAVEVISACLMECELEVYLVVFDKTSYSISTDVFTEVTEYIDNFYTEDHLFGIDAIREEAEYRKYRQRRNRLNSSSSNIDNLDLSEHRKSPSYSKFERSEQDGAAIGTTELLSFATLDDMIKNMDKGFADTLFYYIDKKGLSDVEAYKRSNVGKKTFSKIKCTKNYRPSKITAVSFAIGLGLDIKETQHLLSTAGMCLSHSNKFDVIIEYFITSGKYKNIFDVNEVLYQFDQPLLGV